MTEYIIEAKGLKKHFSIRRGLMQRSVGCVRAVDGIDLSIRRGETLGIVGESGSGKSTAARALINLIPPTGGQVLFDGQDMLTRDRALRKSLRRKVNMVFQDPFGSLDPRMTVAQIVAEPLPAYHLARSPRDALEQAVALIESCGLFADQVYRYPHQFSGGQRQRICIARALAARPEFIVCDEAVSALDVSIQAQIINLLCDLKEQRRLTYLFISHDLNVVRFISDHIAVMYLGLIVEKAPKEEMFSHPLHPYTVALLAAQPVFDPDAEARERTVLEGSIPSPSNPPPGCHFHTRCPQAMSDCGRVEPTLREVEPGHYVSCHLYD